MAVSNEAIVRCRRSRSWPYWTASREDGFAPSFRTSMELVGPAESSRSVHQFWNVPTEANSIRQEFHRAAVKVPSLTKVRKRSG